MADVPAHVGDQADPPSIDPAQRKVDRKSFHQTGTQAHHGTDATTRVARRDLRELTMSNATLPMSPTPPAAANRALSDRRAVQPRDLGVNFPEVGQRRSSTASAKHVLSEAVRGLDPDLAQTIRDADGWRSRYPGVFEELTRLEASSPEAAGYIADTGLAAATEHFVFATDGGDQPLSEAMQLSTTTLETVTIAGRGDRQRRLEVPYEGNVLHGSALLRQLDSWARRGITEPSFAEAIGAVVRNPEWLELGDRTFALVGAGAAMGPFEQLMRWGATVAAVDLPRPDVWQRLARIVDSSPGSMLIPVRGRVADPTMAAGANLLTEPGAIAGWLRTVPGPLTIGNYGYADGALFVRLSLAFELLVRQLTLQRDDLSLSYLATPSDAFLVPQSAVQMADERLRRRATGALAARLVNAVSGGSYFQPNYTELLETPHGRYGLVNAFIVEQGQNYALAKRLQRWRMIASRADSLLTSVHVARHRRARSRCTRTPSWRNGSG
jgi:hypothetical protein